MLFLPAPGSLFSNSKSDVISLLDHSVYNHVVSTTAFSSASLCNLITLILSAAIKNEKANRTYKLVALQPTSRK